jgi:hypothetical protein
VQKGHALRFSHVECYKRLIAISHRSCSLVLPTHFPVRYKLLVLPHPCKYKCCWETFTKLYTMFCNNGIYRDVTLLVDGWCAMACQHALSLVEHAFIV